MRHTIFILISLSCALTPSTRAEDFADGPRSWREAVYRSLYGLTAQVKPKDNMAPLLPRSKPWHVSLVVEDVETRTGVFCQGAMVAKGWVLTSGTCVCAPGGWPPMEVIVDRETAVEPGRRLEVNQVWIYATGGGRLTRLAKSIKLSTLH